MIKNTSRKIKEKIGKRNVKTYLLFVALTTFLWLALQFSKNYSQEVSFNIEYTNVSKEKIVTKKSDKEIKMVLEGNGFQLLRYALLQKTVLLDASKATQVSENYAYFTGNGLSGRIKAGLDYSGNISYLLKDSIHIHYDVFEEKLLKLEIVAEVNYAQGFTSIDGVTSTVEEVTAIGPRLALDTLKTIQTEELRLNNLKEDYSGKLRIAEYKQIPNFRVKEETVPVNILVSKLTEGEFKVPISLKNMPEGAKIQLFPKVAPVIFSVGLGDYKKLSIEDFKVSADLSKSKNGNNLQLSLDQFPASVFNARLGIKKVQYVIINK